MFLHCLLIYNFSGQVLVLQSQVLLVVPVWTTELLPCATDIIRMTSKCTAKVANNGHSQTAIASVARHVNTPVQNIGLHPNATVTIFMTT